MDHETLMLIGALVFLAYVLGHLSGAGAEAKYWRSKADEYRTVVCSNGQFFYVVPEREYVELDRLRVQRDWPQLCGLLDEVKGDQ